MRKESDKKGFARSPQDDWGAHGACLSRGILDARSEGVAKNIKDLAKKVFLPGFQTKQVYFTAFCCFRSFLTFLDSERAVSKSHVPQRTSVSST